jgi:integrase
MAMKGFMRQRGTSWELRVYLGADPVTGKQRYSSKSVRCGKREAQRTLNEMIVAAERGAMVRTTATVGDLLTEWIEFAAPDFSPKTEKETRGYIERNLRPALGSVPLGRLKPSDLDKYYRSLLVGGGARGGPLAPGTVKRIHGILRSALNRVLASDIKPPSLPELGRVLLRAAAEEPELACFLLLAAATGARRSEVVALRWSDVDIDSGQVAIARGVVAGMNGLVEKDTKTRAARRVSLDVGTLEVLREHQARATAHAAAFEVELPPGGFVFSNELDGSKPWYPDLVSRGFKRLCRKEGLPETTRLHDLRHFVATQLLAAGVDVRTVAGRLDHRNASTTLNVYAYFLQEADRSAADVMGDIIDRARKQ